MHVCKCFVFVDSFSFLSMSHIIMFLCFWGQSQKIILIDCFKINLHTLWQEAKLKIFLQIGGAINLDLCQEVFLGQSMPKGNQPELAMIKIIARGLCSVKKIRRTSTNLSKYVSFFEVFSFDTLVSFLLGSSLDPCKWLVLTLK